MERLIARNPRKFWTQSSNQRLFLTQVASQLGIKNPCEWGSVTVKQLEKRGGRGLTNKFGRSVLRTLQSAFPGIHSPLTVKY